MSTLPPTNAPSESSFPPEPQQPHQSKTEPNRRANGTGRNHRSNHRHHSPNKTARGRHKGKKLPKQSKKKDNKESEGNRHHSGGNHRSRHRSPKKGHSRSRSADNTLDSRHRHGRGRSPERRYGQSASNHRNRSPRRSPHRSPRRSPQRSPRRSPQRSPRRSPHRSPHRHRSPQRSRQHSPTRRRIHSYDPYRYGSPERHNPSNEKPIGDEAVLREPPKSPEPSLPFEDSILQESLALDRLNRDATLPPLRGEDRLYGEDSLLRRVSSMERVYRGDRLLKTLASRDQVDSYRSPLLPRPRTPDSGSAFQKYSTLLRGHSPVMLERERSASRDNTLEPHYRARSLGRDISPIRSHRRHDSEDEEDDDNFVADKVREYYSTLKSNTSRSSQPMRPEPKNTYKENPKDLSI
ncbi:uncharacterized protein FYW49_004317 [Xenentodon cancila]